MSLLDWLKSMKAAVVGGGPAARTGYDLAPSDDEAAYECLKCGQSVPRRFATVTEDAQAARGVLLPSRSRGRPMKPGEFAGLLVSAMGALLFGYTVGLDGDQPFLSAIGGALLGGPLGWLGYATFGRFAIEGGGLQ